MSKFWDKSDGSSAAESAQASYEAPSNDIEPMPDGTVVIFAPNSVEWREYEGNRYISIDWVIVDGKFKNRHIFHKLYLYDPKDKKRDKALDLFASICENIGKPLLKLDDEPTDAQLTCILNKPIEARLTKYDFEAKDASGNIQIDPMTGEAKRIKGNGVGKIGPVGSLGKSAPAPAPAPKKEAAKLNVEDDDIPF